MNSQVFAKALLRRLISQRVPLSKGGSFMLNRTTSLLLLSIMMLLPGLGFAQEQNFPLPSATGELGNKDAGALAEIKAYLQVVSAFGWKNLEAKGTLTYPQGDVHSAALYLKGSKYSRLDITMDSGMRSFRVSGFVGSFRNEKGVPGTLSPTTSSSGIVAFPRLWADAAVSTRISLYDHKIYVSTGQNLHRITIEYPLDDEDGSSLSKRTAATDLYFDPSTHLLLFSVDAISVSTMRRRLVRVTSYANYQPCEGISVPTTIKQTLGGQDLWALQLNQIEINTTLPTSGFIF